MSGARQACYSLRLHGPGAGVMDRMAHRNRLTPTPERVFRRVEAYDSVPAAMDEIDDLDRSCHQVAAVRAGGADR
jgi:hypothetical protein